MIEEQFQQLYIPKKLNVGFQKREETYTGQLAYIIYYDDKGVLRKEKSWQGWRDTTIEPKEIDNVPTDGFVLNKKVGGYKSHWNFRDAHVRVYDPRNFEFEISVPNLLFILKEGVCHPGKGLDGKFVYAWSGTELVLLPCRSGDYQRSQSFTSLQGKAVNAKEMKEGITYLTKRQDELIFLGKMDYYYYVDSTDNNPKKDKGVTKKFVFWNGENFVFLNDTKSLAVAKDDSIHPDFAGLVDNYNKSPHGSKVVKLFLDNISNNNTYNWFFDNKDGTFMQCQHHSYNYTNNKLDYIHYNSKWYVDKTTGLLTRENFHGVAYNPTSKHPYNSYRSERVMPFIEPTNLALYAETENGCRHLVVSGADYYGYQFSK